MIKNNSGDESAYEMKCKSAEIWILRLNTLLMSIVLLLFLFVASSIYDMYRFAYMGSDSIEYHDFASLRETNPDIRAWLTIDGTGINHPVVQGRDNFEYLDKDFYGNFYAGGTLFLDCNNNSDFEDQYNIIHGHNMAGGAMFGDLGKFREEEFFVNNRTGVLMTEDSIYRLYVVGVGSFDAYDMSIYSVGSPLEFSEVRDRCDYSRNSEFHRDDKLLALSTCSGDMSNNRTVLFLRMRYESANNY